MCKMEAKEADAIEHAQIAYPVDGGRCKVEAKEADSVERAKITYSGRRWSASKFVHKRFKLPKGQLLSNVPGYCDPVDGGQCKVEAKEADAVERA